MCPGGSYSSTTGASSCIKCSAGYYSNQGAASCTKCSTKYPNCKTCNNTQCIECETNYKLSDDKQKCEKKDCPAKTIKIPTLSGDICVTQYNMGDQSEFPLTGVSVVSVNSKCSGSACCWQGRTAEGCDSANGGYSGCNRTLCTHYGAQRACANLHYDNRSWRLPTNDEVVSFASYSINKGASGLMLCDIRQGYGSAWCDLNTSACTGSTYNHCEASYVWSNNVSGDNAYFCRLNSGSWNLSSYPKTFTRSVRCVTELK